MGNLRLKSSGGGGRRRSGGQERKPGRALLEKGQSSLAGKKGVKFKWKKKNRPWSCQGEVSSRKNRNNMRAGEGRKVKGVGKTLLN